MLPLFPLIILILKWHGVLRVSLGLLSFYSSFKFPFLFLFDWILIGSASTYHINNNIHSFDSLRQSTCKYEYHLIFFFFFFFFFF